MQPDAKLDADCYRFAEDRVTALSVAGRRQLFFDIEAGDGGFRRLAGEDFEWIGFDREAWGEVVRWDLVKPCPLAERRADIVLLLDVIEHLLNPRLALRNIAAAMKPGGTLIVTTPNPRWSGSRINTHVRGEISSFSQRDFDENYHFLPIWPHVLARFAAEVGLVPYSYVTLGGATKLFEAKGRLSGFLRYAINAAQMVIEAADRSAHGNSYGMVCVKSSDRPEMLVYPSADNAISR